MKVDIDFEVAGEGILITFTPQDAKERVVCGALYMADYVIDETIDENAAYTLRFGFKEKKS